MSLVPPTSPAPVPSPEAMALHRRAFLAKSGFSLGGMALSSLLARDAAASAPAATTRTDPLAPRLPRFAPRARSVIFLNMNGAPPQLDLFDYKPKLSELNGQIVPPSFTKGERFAFIQGDAKLLGSPFEFRRHGSAGIWMSSVLEPHLPRIADDLCVIRSMHTDQFNHAPAQLFFFTGSPRSGRPSMGSWICYGLGCEADDLPGFVAMQTGGSSRCGDECFGSGFLPSIFQGVLLGNGSDPVLYLNNPPGIGRDVRRRTLGALERLNASEEEAFRDPEIPTRIAQYEMAFRMQMSVPELADISTEPEAVHKLYGTRPGQRWFGNACLLARRLVERGVRFVQVSHGDWDLHGGSLNLRESLPRLANETMQGAAALVIDLKQRGLLEDTLVVWGAEFGRTPMLQGEMGPQVGRDHHRTFTVWLAGGGVRGGFVHGATDEIGYRPVESPVDVHDLQATILHLLGLDHERLTYRFQGRDFRLTDVHGDVVREILV